jgi:hypothetical protein
MSAQPSEPIAREVAGLIVFCGLAYVVFCWIAAVTL